MRGGRGPTQLHRAARLGRYTGDIGEIYWRYTGDIGELHRAALLPRVRVRVRVGARVRVRVGARVWVRVGGRVRATVDPCSPELDKLG